MKITAIIAEYNPFHNGHAYQIAKARELTGADAVLIIMSGNFVQRGTPAILDKYTRASMAIRSGADLILELPCVYATGSAEYFAMGAVSTLEALGCVDSLVFGAETDSLADILFLSDILATPPALYTDLLQQYCKEGLSFPVARDKALQGYLTHADGLTTQDCQRLSTLLQQPNNILALEYCKALQILHSNIHPFLLQRTSDNYHSAQFTDAFCSATAIRNLLLPDIHTATGSTVTPLNKLSQYVPENTMYDYTFASENHLFLSEDDLSLPLHWKLLAEVSVGYSDYLDITNDLSNKIQNLSNHYTDYTSFCQLLKSKDLTYTRISRALLHIALGIKKGLVPNLDAVRAHYETEQAGHPLAYYARPLAMSTNGRMLLSEISANSTIPLIAKVCDWETILEAHTPFENDQIQTAKSNFALDLSSAHYYEALLTARTGHSIHHEYQRMLKPIP